MTAEGDLPGDRQRADAKGAGAVAVNVAQYGTATIYQNVVRLTDAQLGLIAMRLREASGAEALSEGQTETCPYPGLETFLTSEAEFFAGRDDEVAELAAAVDRFDISASISASGAGKSSLVNAGLIPALGRRESEKWDIFAFRPGREPLKALSRAISAILERDVDHDDRLGVINRRVQSLRTGEVPLRDHLELLRASRLDAAAGRRYQVLFVIDQWEELYIQTDTESDRGDLIRELLDVTERGLAKVLLTMRADFMGDLLDGDNDFLRRVKPGICYLEQMTETSLRAAILKPAAAVDLSVPEDLTSRLVADTRAQPGALPYLQFVLHQLWEQREKATNSLTTEAYDNMEGLKGAIGRHASRVLEGLTQKEQQLAARIIPRLVNVLDTGEPTSRRLSFSDFDEDARALLRKLAEPDKRQIVLSVATDNAADSEIIAEVAHEALLREWNELKGWIADRGAFFRLRNKLEAQAKDWIENDRNPEFLIPAGKPLLDAQEVLASATTDDISQDLAEFIGRSVTKKKDDDEAQRQADKEQFNRLKTRNRGLMALSAVFIVATIGAGYFWNQSLVAADEADEQRALAESNASELREAINNLDRQVIEARLAEERANRERENAEAATLLAEEAAREAAGRQLGAEALVVASNASRLEEFELAAALALEAIQLYPTANSYQAASKAMQQLPARLVRFNGTKAMSYSPDGKLMVVASDDMAHLVSILEDGLAIAIQHTIRSIEDVAFSANRNEVILFGSFGEVEAFEATNGNLKRTLGESRASASGVSADGAFYVSKGSDRFAFIYDTYKGSEVGRVETHTDSYVATVHNGGLGVVQLDSNDVLQTYYGDEPSGTPITSLKVGPHLYSESVNSIHLSHDQELIALAVADGTVRVIELSTGEEIFKLFRTLPEYVTFSASGEIAVISQNTSAFGTGYPEVVDYRTGNLVSTFQYSSDDIRRIVVSGRSASVAILDHSSDVSVLDMSSTGRILLSERLEGSYPVFAFDGEVVAVANTDGYVFHRDDHVRSDVAQQEIEVLEFSSSGDAVLMGGAKGLFQLKNFTSGTTYTVEFESPIVAMAASGDAQRVVISDSDRNICRVYLLPENEVRCIEYNDVAISLKVSQDGSKFLAVGAEGAISLFDFDSISEIGTELKVGEPNETDGEAVSIAFFQGQARVAFLGRNHSIRILDVVTRKTIAQFQEDEPVTDIAFSEDGSLVLVRSSETVHGNYRIYDVSYRDLSELLCVNRVGRNLTQAEWHRYIGASIDWRPTCPEWANPRN